MIVLGFCFYTFLGPNVYMRCEFNGLRKSHYYKNDAAAKKMLSALDDPFTRFLKPLPFLKQE